MTLDQYAQKVEARLPNKMIGYNQITWDLGLDVAQYNETTLKEKVKCNIFHRLNI